MNTCKSLKNYGSFDAPLAAYFKSFVNRGIMADFSDRRGSKTKNIIIDYQSSGLNSFAANKVVNFNQDLELDNSNIKAIELLSSNSLIFAPTSPQKDIPELYFSYGILRLFDACENLILETSLSNISRKTNGNQLSFVNLKGVNWAASGVVFSTGAVISSANALVFKIHY